MKIAHDFVLPEGLSAKGYGLRLEREGDRAFLLELYGSTRAAELAPTGWAEDQKRAFLQMQFEAQSRHYGAHLPDCVRWIVTVRDEPIGRLYLDDRSDRVHVVDISLQAERTGQGVGTAILEALVDQADTYGMGVSVMVEKMNPALRLYQRLAFEVVFDHGVYLEMARPILSRPAA